MAVRSCKLRGKVDENVFLGIEQWKRDSIAIEDDEGRVVSYGELCDFVDTLGGLGLPRSLVFCLCQNSAGSLAGFVAFMSHRQVPVLLNANLDRSLLSELDERYAPSYYWVPRTMESEFHAENIFEAYGYVLLKTKNAPYPVNDKLSMLLTTSGSTGSPKMVRHKYGNLEANARNVATVFSWTSAERGICDLPMHYTMGLNVINSHLVSGATVLMIQRNLMDPEFWTFTAEHEGTNFCGVPYSYEVMRRVGFDKMDLPKLRTLAEGGGKLTDKMFQWIAGYCAASGRRFFATFGTSETSARMCFLPPELALEKIGSIGKAIPQGELFLLDEKVNDDGSADGELGYRGPNVTMGYALNREELLKDDEFQGEYHTGDIARRDQDGFYYIIGRKKRFLKLYGLRVSLDQTERILRTEFGCECVCTGDDRHMNIYITDPSLKEKIRPFISEKTHLHISTFRVFVVDEIPRNDYGKVKYAQLDALANVGQ